jgi:3-oxoacyl-(acyl-carrier-protein) reductase
VHSHKGIAAERIILTAVAIVKPRISPVIPQSSGRHGLLVPMAQLHNGLRERCRNGSRGGENERPFWDFRNRALRGDEELFSVIVGLGKSPTCNLGKNRSRVGNNLIPVWTNWEILGLRFCSTHEKTTRSSKQEGSGKMSVVEREQEAQRPEREVWREAVTRKVLQGKKALVTGGSRGIGRATVLALAEAGAEVAINYQQSAQAADEVCRGAQELGVTARTYRADISREEEAQQMVDAILGDFGPIDILVNNAGITRDKSFLKMTRAFWDEVLGVNLTGVFNITRALLPGMVEAGWGRVINMASIVGQTGNFGQANYAVSKGGLIAFTMTLAREVSRKGVTVNAVAPGFIDTDMTKDMPEAALATVKAMTPVGRLGRAEEVAAAVQFLASPLASYITGQVIAVNGGMYM